MNLSKNTKAMALVHLLLREVLKWDTFSSLVQNTVKR